MADNNEPIRMPIFAESKYKGFSTKAKLAMKIDIVNPIPPKKETPIICLELISKGMSINFNFFDKKIMAEIPKLLPITNPTVMLIANAISK